MDIYNSKAIEMLSHLVANMKAKLWRILQEFSYQTTIHGVPFFGAPRLHYLERFFSHTIL